MTAARRKRVSERIYPRIAPALAQRLTKHAAASGISETAIVEAALELYLDRTSDTTLLMRRLDRLGRAQERSQRDQELHAEAFAAFVRMSFAQTPSIPQDAAGPRLPRRRLGSASSCSTSRNKSRRAAASSTSSRASRSAMSGSSPPSAQKRPEPMPLRTRKADSPRRRCSGRTQDSPSEPGCARRRAGVLS